MLSSVYYKPPETFVKKIRDKINERLDLENDDDLLGNIGGGNTTGKQKNQEDYIDSSGVARSQYIQDQPQGVYTYSQDLLDVDDKSNTGTAAIDDLLGMGSS